MAKRFIPASTRPTISLAPETAASSAATATSTLPPFLQSLINTSTFSSEESYDNMRNFSNSVPRTLAPVVLDASFDFGDWISKVAMVIAMFPRVATLILLPLLHASIKSTDQSFFLTSEHGVLATIDEVMKLFLGLLPASQFGDGIHFESAFSYLALRFKITQLRRQMAYRTFQLPSSDFQSKVRDEIRMSVSERDGSPIIVWGGIIDELRQATTDARDDETLRRLIVQTLDQVHSPHLPFFISISNPAEPTLDTMLAIMLSLHTQQLTPTSSAPRSMPIMHPSLTPAVNLRATPSFSPTLGPYASSTASASVAAIQTTSSPFPVRSDASRLRRPVPPRYRPTDSPSASRSSSNPDASRSATSTPRLSFRPTPVPRSFSAASRSHSVIPPGTPPSAAASRAKGRNKQARLAPDPAVQSLYNIISELHDAQCSSHVSHWLDKVNSQLDSEVKFLSPYRAAKDLWKANVPQSRQLLRELRDLHRSSVQPASVSAVSAASTSPPPTQTISAVAPPSSPLVDAPASLFHVAATQESPLEESLPSLSNLFQEPSSTIPGSSQAPAVTIPPTEGGSGIADA